MLIPWTWKNANGDTDFDPGYGFITHSEIRLEATNYDRYVNCFIRRDIIMSFMFD